MMQRKHFELLVSALLFVSLALTALLGYIQSSLELRRYVPHRYFAYATLLLAALHVALNFKRIAAHIRSLRK